MPFLSVTVLVYHVYLFRIAEESRSVLRRGFSPPFSHTRGTQGNPDKPGESY